MVKHRVARVDALPACKTKAEGDLSSRLKAGDEMALKSLVVAHHASMIRFAMGFVRSRASAEEVVQETWLAVIGGLRGFEARSSLLTWVYSILANKARTRGVREARSSTFSDLGAGNNGDAPLNAGRFDGNGMWADPPRPWDDLNPERIVASKQLWVHVTRILEDLPAMQKAVVTLQDIEGQDAETVCHLLQLSNANRRVLLHRARAKIRQEIEALIGPDHAER